MYVEFVEKKIFNRGQVVASSDIDARAVRPYEAYVSIYGFDQSIYSHLEFTKSDKYPKGTVDGYEGNYHARRVWWDFDEEGDLLSAYMDTKRLLNGLISKMGLPKDIIGVFFSGCKGFHVTIPADVFGGFSPAPDLPYLIGDLCAEIALQCSPVDHETKAPVGLRTMDTSIYSANRIFRLPNSKHPKSGLYKIPLTMEELLSLRVDGIKELAKAPRPDFAYNVPPKILENEKLKKIWALVSTKPEESKEEREILETVPGEPEGIFELAVKMTARKKDYNHGGRNDYAHLLAQWANDLGYGDEAGEAGGEKCWERIKAHLMEDFGEGFAERRHEADLRRTVVGVYRRGAAKFARKSDYLRENKGGRMASYETRAYIIGWIDRMNKGSRFGFREALTLCVALNEGRKHPLTEEEVYNLVIGHFQAKQRERREDDLGKTLGQLSGEFVQMYRNFKPGAGLGFPKIEKLEHGDWRGRVVGVIGKAGSGKSRILKQMALTTGRGPNGERGLLSVMEDGAINQFKRYLDSIIGAEFDPTTKRYIKPHHVIRDQLIANQGNEEFAKKWIEILARDISQEYGDRIMLDDVTRMSAEEYDWLVEQHIKKFGRLDLLGVDGLSMMQQNGKEWEAAAENSAGLKAVANKYKMLVVPLIHVPKDIPRDARALYDHTRGGGKVMDNCDAFISVSQIANEEESVPGAPVYWDNYIYIDYWGKRMSGRKISFIMELDEKTMEYIDTDLTLEDFARMARDGKEAAKGFADDTEDEILRKLKEKLRALNAGMEFSQAAADAQFEEEASQGNGKVDPDEDLPF